MINTMTTHIYNLAAGCSAGLGDSVSGTSDCSTSFFSTGIGSILGYFMAVIGILVVIFSIGKGIMDYLGNKGDKSVVSIFVRIFITAILAAALIAPSVVSKLITTGSNVVTKTTTTIDNGVGSTTATR